MDIVIYTNPETLEHKRGRDEAYERYYQWSMSRPPKNFEPEDKIYFAIKGQVVGYFVCDEYYPDDEEMTIVWDCFSWKGLKKKILTKPFRGFRYRWWKLKEEYNVQGYNPH